jgi:hypothetical protein
VQKVGTLSLHTSDYIHSSYLLKVGTLHSEIQVGMKLLTSVCIQATKVYYNYTMVHKGEAQIRFM